MPSESPKEEAFLKKRDALMDHIASVLAEERLRLIRQGTIRTHADDNYETKKGE